MFSDFYNILTECAAYLSGKEKFILFIFSMLLGGVCWWCCASYTKLWHKQFYVKAQHHILCGIAALLTIAFVYGFYSIRYLEDLVYEIVEEWEDDLLDNYDWSEATFEKAFYATKAVDPTAFKRVREPKDGGQTIPLETQTAIQVCAETYVYEACASFASAYRFLNRFLKAKTGISKEAIKDDINNYFNAGHSVYPAEQAIELAAWYIETELIAQAPAIVKKTRTVLFLLFLLIQAIPFSIIGYVAYNNLKLKQYKQYQY